jgi:predicted outer membrane lipoprotein
LLVVVCPIQRRPTNSWLIHSPLALAIGAVVALGLTLVASVNRGRRDLALLRTLGFKSRQLLAAVA